MSTVVITGAEQGLGLELARAYAAEGHSVVAGCLRPDTPGMTALKKERRNVGVVLLDVTREGSVAALADRLHEKPVDVVINNAGVHFRKWSVPERVSFADWEATLQVNTSTDTSTTSAHWVSIAQIEGAHAGDHVNVLIDSHSAIHHVDLLI